MGCPRPIASRPPAARRAHRKGGAVAHVVSIVYRPKKAGRPQDHYERVPAERVQLAPFKGIEGDQKGGSTKRQLNIMCAEMLAELGTEGFNVKPGEMGE